MTIAASPKLLAYTALGGAGILAALIWGHPEAAALGLPFIVAALTGLALVEAPRLTATVDLDCDRLLEGDELHASVRLESATAVPLLQLAWPLNEPLEVGGGREVVGVRLAPGEPLTVTTPIVPRRWGVVSLPGPLLRAYDELGFFRFEGSVELGRVVRVYPRPETIRRAVSAAETQMFSGNELARQSGDGTEFADVRPYVAGDRVRHVNWRMSTRTGRLHINEMHPERNTDVVIFLDLFSDVRRGGPSRGSSGGQSGGQRGGWRLSGDEGTLDFAVRAAATLAGYYLARRDRVGLVGFAASCAGCCRAWARARRTASSIRSSTPRWC